MGNIFKSVNKTLLFGLILISFEVLAQDTFVVFKKTGTPVFRVNDSLAAIYKGTTLDADCSVTLANNDTLLYVNKEGSCFFLEDPGTYGYANLAAVPPKEDNTSFTRRYFAYVWDEFIKNKKSVAKTGVVYRIENVTMIKPADSVRIYRPSIEFSWMMDAPESYFMLRDQTSGHLTKIATPGTRLTLFVDNVLLKKGHAYQWAVSDVLFPDLSKLEFNRFEVLSQEELRSMEASLKALKADLSALGLTAEEINRSLCSDYKLCF